MDTTWKINWRWKNIILPFCLSLVMGKLISVVYHTNWMASTLWFFAWVWFIYAFRSYNEYGLSYFDGKTGKFQPRFPQPARLKIFLTLFAIAVAISILGLVVQFWK